LVATPDDPPESIGIRELRQNASKYVALAKAGKRVPVTERGKLVAYLVPAEEATMTTFQRMVAAGQVRASNGEPLLQGLLPIPPAQPGESSPFEELMRMRDEERY
jgi:prevent-host-death family protein